MNVTTAVVPDTRRKLQDERYPLKLRVTYQRMRRYYSLSHERRKGVDFNVTHNPKAKDKENGKEKTEWGRVSDDSPRGRYRDIKLLIPEILKDADEIIAGIRPFSFQAFEKAYHGTGKAKNLYGMFESYISELKSESRISTAQSYQCALNSLKGYDKNADFHTVTADFLKKYEAWMTDKDNSVTTTGIYLRSLRTIFNVARKQQLSSHYPFIGYTIPTGANKKKALEIDEIGKIINYQTTIGTPKDKAKDLWVFSYFSNGMNVKDICSLKIKDIDLESLVIRYLRQMTKRSSRTQIKIEVDLIPETLAIVEKWGKLIGDRNDYVFPFFYKGITPEQQRSVTQNVVKQTNKYINEICKKVGIKWRVNTYHARHSFANILKQSGAPIEFISESMGHSDLKTTESYLKSFSSEYRKKWKSQLNPNKQKNMNNGPKKISKQQQ